MATTNITAYLIDEYDNLLLGWCFIDAEWKKYESTENRAALRKRFLQYLPSMTALKRAFLELIHEGAIARTDGGSSDSDAAATKKAEEARAKREAKRPLTSDDYQGFAAMSTKQVAELFASDVFFRERYKVASEKWGFKLPGAF